MTPIAVSAEKIMTATVASVPKRERRSKAITITMTMNMAGTTLPISSIAASLKALLKKTMPEMYTSSSGYRALRSSAIFLEKATTSGTSAIDSPGRFIVTFTAVTRASGERRRFRMSGSASAIPLTFSSSSLPRRSAPFTRSSTTRSSSKARVCWKFVIESTRSE